jgi:Prolipoprotein diacylglyceryl transferase
MCCSGTLPLVAGGHLDVGAVVASIPSPSSRVVVRAGPVDLRWYGLLIAVGAVVGWCLARRGLRRRGIDEEIASTVALWTIPFGLVGARLYHVSPTTSCSAATWSGWSTSRRVAWGCQVCSSAGRSGRRSARAAVACSRS